MKLEREALKKLIKESLHDLQADISKETSDKKDIEEGLMDMVPGSSARKMKKAVTRADGPPRPGGDDKTLTATGGVGAKYANALMSGIENGDLAKIKRGVTGISGLGEKDMPDKALILTTIAMRLLKIPPDQLSTLFSAATSKRTSVKPVE